MTGGGSAPGPAQLAVLKHLVQRLGAPQRRIALPGQRSEIAVYAPAPEAPAMYISCGLSEERAGRRLVELILIFQPQPAQSMEPTIAETLLAFGEHDLAAEQTVAMPTTGRALWPMDKLLLLPPLTFPEDFRRLSLPDGTEVELLWALPVFETEAQYAAAHGSDALLDLFSAQALNPVRSDRRVAAMGVVGLSQKLRGPASFDVVEEGAGVVVVRPKSRPPTAARPPTPAPPLALRAPAPRSPASSRGGGAAVRRAASSAAPPPRVVRFELPRKPEPETPLGRASSSSPEDPAQAKRKRIQELKKIAQTRAERARAKKNDTDPNGSGPSHT